MGILVFCLLAPLNLPVTIPVHASQLYARNISNFLALIIKDAALRLDFADEIISGSCVAHQGKITNPRVAAILDPDAALKYGGTLPDQFMDARHLPYPAVNPKPFDKLKSLCQ